jgi:hypothetical protein
MRPRVHSLRQGFVRMKWKSPTGYPHHLDIPRRAKKALQAAFESAPPFLDPAPAPSTELMAQLIDWSQPLDPQGATRYRSCLDWLMSKLAPSPQIIYSSVALSSSVKQALNGASPIVAADSTNTAPSALSLGVQDCNDDAPRPPPRCTGKLGTGNDDGFFGLRAKESFVYWRMTAYICILIALCVVFCALWLSEGKHPFDLQNAVVPLTTCVGLTSILIVLMRRGQTSAGRK